MLNCYSLPLKLMREWSQTFVEPSGSCHKRQNHKRQRGKRQSVTAKREKSQTLKFLPAILTLPNLN